MSNQERMQSEIEHNEKLIEEIKEDIQKVSNELKEEGLSEEKLKELDEKLKELEAEIQDIQADIGVLKEILHKHRIQESRCGALCDGKCQTCLQYEDGGYDGWSEVFTGGDY